MTPEETRAIGEYLCFFPAVRLAARQHKRTSHELRILFAIYQLKTHLEYVTRQKVVDHTYLWRPIVLRYTLRLIDYGYIEPLKKGNFLYLTPLGLSVVSDIMKEYRRFSRKLEEGKEKKRVKR